MITSKHLMDFCGVWGIVLSRCKAYFPPFLKVGLQGGKAEDILRLRRRAMGVREVDSMERLGPDPKTILDSHGSPFLHIF